MAQVALSHGMKENRSCVCHRVQAREQACLWHHSVLGRGMCAKSCTPTSTF